MVGYEISPLLWSKIKRGLSAGRVQSVALRIIYDREQEINAFIPTEYWTLNADISVDQSAKTIEARFLGDKNGKIEIKNKEEMDLLLKELKGLPYQVLSLKQGERKKKPPLPFTTSTLQQEASHRFNFSTQKTMRLAQELYEGVTVKGRGNIGLITYLRTDSTRISEEADQSCRDYIREEYGEENVLLVFDQMMTAMDDARVPRNGRVLYVTPTVRTLISNAKQIYRHIDLNSAESAIRRAVTSIDEVKIPNSVPKDMMKTLYDFTEGWAIDDDALQINMCLIHPTAVITPISYEFAKLDPPTAGSQGKWDYFEESFEDVFVLPNKVSAIAFNIENIDSKFNTVAEPTGNPSTSSYYEKVNGIYVASADTSVVAGKTYYTKKS